MDTMLLATRVPFKTGSPGAYTYPGRAAVVSSGQDVTTEDSQLNGGEDRPLGLERGCLVNITFRPGRNLSVPTPANR